MARNPFYDRFADFAALHDWWDDVTNFAQEVIPDKTIAGKLIDGDISGAASATVNYLNVGAQSAQQVRQTSSPQPGVFGTMPSWLLLAGAGLAIMIIMKKK